MRLFKFYMLAFYFKSVYSQDDYSDASDITEVLNKYKSNPLYRQVEEECHRMYGNRKFTILERINFLSENLKSIDELRNKGNIPEDLKSLLRLALNDLKITFGKLNHHEDVLHSLYNLTDSESTYYRKIYTEAKNTFSVIEKRFQVEADC